MKRLIIASILLMVVNLVNAQSWQTVGQSPNGGTGRLYVDIDSNELYVSGSFSNIGGINTSNVAKWDDNIWDSINQNGATVYSVFRYQDTLYGFGSVDTLTALSSTLIKWDGNNWVPLIFSMEAASNTPRIYDWVIYNNDLYLSGNFDSINGIEAENMIKYDGNFSAINVSSQNPITSMVVHNNILYYAFTVVTFTTVRGSKIWGFNGTNSFPRMTDIGFYVKDMESHNGILVAGGFGGYLASTGAPTPPYLISLTGTTNWSTSNNLPPNVNNFSNFRKVNCLKSDGTTLYIGTDSQPFVQTNIFSTTNNGNITTVAGGVNDRVHDIEIYNNNVYISGGFTQAGGNNVSHLAKLTYPAPTSSFIASNNNTSVCIDNSITFSNTSSDAVTYSWSFPGGTPSSSSSTSPSVTYDSSGVYDVILIAIGPGGNDTLTRTNYITVDTLPAEPTIIYSGGDLNSSITTGVTYQWYLSNQAISGANQSSFWPQTNGFYSLEITNSNGCKSISQPYAFNSVGINESDFALNISLYPNPVSSILNIRGVLETNEKVNLNLKDLSGKTIMTKNIDNSYIINQKIDISSLLDGIYLLEITDGFFVKTYKLSVIR